MEDMGVPIKKRDLMRFLKNNPPQRTNTHKTAGVAINIPYGKLLRPLAACRYQRAAFYYLRVQLYKTEDLAGLAVAWVFSALIVAFFNVYAKQAPAVIPRWQSQRHKTARKIYI